MPNLVKDEVYSVEVLDKISDSELEKLAKKKASEILRNIHSASLKIKDAQELAEKANDIDTGGSDWSNLLTFGYAGKSAEDKLRDAQKATNTALIKTNEAVAELNNIVQESVKFTQLTGKFSRYLSSAMAFVLKNGLKNANGKIVKLSGESAQTFSSIIDAADRFAANHVKLEQTHDELKQLISEQEQISKLQTRQIDELNEALQSKYKIDESQEKAIGENAKNIENILANLDQKHELDSKQEEQIAKNAQAIADNAQVIAQNSEILHELQGKNDSISKIIAVAALVIALASLAMHFVKF
ncbi:MULTISPECIES: hypothetical protein [unclassified Campylobacter]|uniref:hypothetical protein n=1 Tax=unclassified Campylobacter TaxID=2593542 RepID=UPI003D327DD2